MRVVDHSLSPRYRSKRPLERNTDDRPFETEWCTPEFMKRRRDERNVRHFIRRNVRDKRQRAAFSEEELLPVARMVVRVFDCLLYTSPSPRD